MNKKLIKSVCFVILLVILLSGFHNIFSFKYNDGIYQWTVFNEEKENSIDVICYGSSHIFENVNTGILWDDYGIASFNLCGSVQPLWNTYYYMKESLRTQHPKVMVVDVYGAVQKDEYIDSSRIIKNNYGLRLSRDKLESIKVSAPEDAWMDYMLEYPTYHSRYSEITASDFRTHLGIANWQYWKGTGINMDTQMMTKPEGLKNITESGELTEKVEKYLRKIIELSKQEDIPLMFIKTPHVLDGETQKIYNRVKEIADENEIPFVNFNLFYDEIGLDFSTDFADVNHLNYIGNVKFTKYFADYLKTSYAIPDRRGEAEYESYDIMAADCRQKVYNQEVKLIQDIGTYLDKIQNESYVVVYSMSGDYKNMENYEAVRDKLVTCGVNLDKVNGDAVWVNQKGESLFTSGNEKTFNWHSEISSIDNLMVKSSDEEGQPPIINLNNREYVAVANGLTLLVYDTFTETVVESVSFQLSDGKLQYGKYNMTQ